MCRGINYPDTFGIIKPKVYNYGRTGIQFFYLFTVFLFYFYKKKLNETLVPFAFMEVNSYSFNQD